MQLFDTRGFAPLIKSGDIHEIEKIFAHASDWDRRETAVIALRTMIWNGFAYDKTVMMDTLARIIELCESEYGGGDYQSSCIKISRELLDHLKSQ